jgi:hypothetical protein
MGRDVDVMVLFIFKACGMDASLEDREDDDHEITAP